MFRVFFFSLVVFTEQNVSFFLFFKAEVAVWQLRGKQMAGMLKMPKIRGRQRHNETKRKQSIRPDLSCKHP